MAVYLKNARFIDFEKLKIEKVDLKITEGLNGGFTKIFKTEPIVSDFYTVIDCQNKFVTKSFACGHHHIYSALALGMPPIPHPINNFHDRLKYLWWELDKNLSQDMIKASALLTGYNCIKNGVTFVIDHHSSPNAIDNSLEIIDNSLSKLGLSNLLCLELSDRDGKITRDIGLAETENYLSSGKQGLVGLHASFTVGKTLLTKSVNLAEKYNSGIHIHCAEDLIDQKITSDKYKKYVIDRLNEAGVLEFPKSILAHCLHLEDSERKLLKNSKAWIAQNSESNMNNSVGFFCSEGLDERIFLGTDGMHSDMLRAFKATYLASRFSDKVNLDIIYNRFRNVHKYLKQNNFKGDGNNNLIIFDYNNPTEVNDGNILSHLFFGIESRNIQTVISNGKIIYENRKLLNMNVEDIFSLSREMSKKLWNKLYK